MKLSKILALVTMTLLLSACGGGSSTPEEDNNTHVPTQTALDKVKAVIAGDDGVSITYEELNRINGVSGAVAGKDYMSALTRGTYADKNQPTPEEIQAVIDAVNAPLSTNHKPTIDGTPTTSILKDKPYSFTPTATDSDGDTLVFSIKNMPSWASFDADTGTLSGTPSASDVGTSAGILIAVSDDIATVELPAFSIKVKRTNVSPTITGTASTSIDADASYSFTPTAIDSDNDTLAFSIVNKPNWASFDTTTGTLSGTPSNADKGTKSGIVIAVNDGTDKVALAAFDIKVNYVNHVPTIEGTPATAIEADSTYTFTPDGGDVDSTDTVRFSIVNRPSWATFDEKTGTLSGTPSNADIGITLGIIISVSDGIKTVMLPAFDVRVKLINHVPTISGTANTTVDADSTYTFTPKATDSDGDTLAFEIAPRPSWATFDKATGTLSGTPSNADKGTTTAIVISVSDGTKTVALAAFNLTVKYMNHTPTITGTASTSIDADASYSFTPTAIDSDNDTLAFSIVNKPNWANFDRSTGKLSGTPSNANVGTTTGIIISVKDSTGSEVALSAFNLTVVHVNHVPTISGTPATQIDANMLYSFTPNGGDVDSTDTVTFSIVNRPSWATFDEKTRTLSGTPSNADIGITSGIVISVSDKIETVSLAPFNLEVNLGKCIDINGDQGYAKAAEISFDKTISKKTSTSGIRLWHTSDDKRKVCVVNGSVSVN